MILTVNNRADLNTFISLPQTLYRGDPHWVQPLVGRTPAEFSNSANPALPFHDLELYILKENGIPVGRIAAFVDYQYNRLHHEATAFFGFFECPDNYAAAQELLAAAASFARTRGMTKIIGPVDFTTNYQAGLLVDGFGRPTIMTPYNMEYYPRLIETAGFTKSMDLYAYNFQTNRPVPGRMKKLETIVKHRYPSIQIKHLLYLRGVNRAQLLRNLYNLAFSQNWGFVPMTAREFSGLINDLSAFGQSVPNYVAFADNTPVGLVLTVPDLYSREHQKDSNHRNRNPISTRLRVTVLGVIPAYRRKGIDALLGVRVLEEGAAAGYKEVEFSVILENNTSMNNMVRREFDLPIQRTFRIYEKII